MSFSYHRTVIFISLAFGIAACGDSTAPKLVTLPLTSIDSRPMPTTIPSSNGTTTIESGYVRGSSNTGACDYHLQTPGGSTLDGMLTSGCIVRSGVATALTLTLPGPVFGPGTHTYRFGP